jgi:hypothetical protein
VISRQIINDDNCLLFYKPGFILWRWEDDGILRRESEDLKAKETEEESGNE